MTLMCGFNIGTFKQFYRFKDKTPEDILNVSKLSWQILLPSKMRRQEDFFVINQRKTVTTRLTARTPS
ncbi:hypothetical protein DXB00_07795 [Butyricicoccus sp. OF10-2]|nr:hypothetical protein DXB00_07795 [Butyricicoccus sp. OF10-2]